MERMAQCACGQLSVTVEGEPDPVAICSCTSCQRRTGSAFGISTYFEKDQVKSIKGNRRDYRRSSDSGRWIEYHFCPECGATVYWTLEFFPNRIGVGAGSFTDPNFPKPVAAVWCATKINWIDLPSDCTQLDDQGPWQEPVE